MWKFLRQLTGCQDALQTLLRGKRLLFSPVSRLAVGPTRLPIQCVPGLLSSGIRRLGYEADHSPPSSAEVELKLHTLMCLRGVYSNNFTLNLRCLLCITVAVIITGSCKFDTSFRNNGLQAILLETTDLLDLRKCRCVQCVITRCPAEKKNEARISKL